MQIYIFLYIVIYTYKLIYLAVHQKQTQHCKSTIATFKRSGYYLPILFSFFLFFFFFFLMVP